MRAPLVLALSLLAGCRSSAGADEDARCFPAGFHCSGSAAVCERGEFHCYPRGGPMPAVCIPPPRAITCTDGTLLCLGVGKSAPPACTAPRVAP